ncbi:hypothetical protein KQX54_003230 [Cotesia glomerata]|uniref:Uncharacterized protein n=1 Tax=Cotesia glomerata TaxID=32391 RepID=A0AAV7IP83_COTGL|nr:hypothetical protein KQX54_003230 [Cotesia glomerata]
MAMFKSRPKGQMENFRLTIPAKFQWDCNALKCLAFSSQGATESRQVQEVTPSRMGWNDAVDTLRNIFALADGSKKADRRKRSASWNGDPWEK